MTDTMTLQNIDSSCWDALCIAPNIVVVVAVVVGGYWVVVGFEIFEQHSYFSAIYFLGTSFYFR
jgi:hypothetical protein